MTANARATSASAPPASSAHTDKPLINLLRGWPAPSMLPVAQLKAATADVLSDADVVVDSLQYGPDAGFEPLRAELAAFLGTAFADYGAPRDPARICITGGASQNAACLLQSFTDPAYTACIWVSAPCYFLMCPIFEDAGFAGRLRSVPEDDQGTDADALERELQAYDGQHPQNTYKSLDPDRKAFRHVVYLVPASSNPSGRTMSRARREQLVRLARRHDALLIADDVYDFLQWPVPARADALAAQQASVPLPAPLPRLVDVDRYLPHDPADALDEVSVRFGHTVSNGSFSKMVAPGMRTGWAEATPDLVYGLSQTGSTRSGGAPSHFGAATIASLMRSGGLDDHLRQTVRPALQWRHFLLVRAVETHLADYVAMATGGLGAGVYGGYFLWLTLRRPDMSATVLAQRALAQENVVVAEGPLFRVKGDTAGGGFDDRFRLCFAYEDPARLDEGVRRLARVFRDWDLPQPDAVADTGSFK